MPLIQDDHVVKDRNEQATGSRYKGQLDVILGERWTANILAFLRPRESPTIDNLQLQTSYPTLVQFEPKPW
jgi:hypothetical protein